ncbi:MAG: hypothetical protein ACOC8H_00580 [bacterium]
MMAHSRSFYEMLPGKGLDSYDFTTPKGAIRARMAIEANADLRAQLELQKAKAEASQDALKKALDTLKTERVIEHDGKAVVLYSYVDRGIDRYEATWLEKGTDGRYRKAYVSTYGWNEMGGDKARIKQYIHEWERRGT